MAKDYQLVFVSPRGECRAEGDSMDDLEAVVSERIASMLMPQNRLEGMSLDEAAEAVHTMYMNRAQNRRSHRGQTRLSRTRAELDAVRCYLADMTLDETVQWLKRNRDLSISRSSVGRFFVALRRLDVQPLRSVQTPDVAGEG